MRIHHCQSILLDLAELEDKIKACEDILLEVRPDVNLEEILELVFNKTNL